MIIVVEAPPRVHNQGVVRLGPPDIRGVRYFSIDTALTLRAPICIYIYI